MWKHERRAVRRARSCHDLDHLRDHVPRPLHHHRVANAHIEPRDLVGIVQGGVGHDHPAHRDRPELGHRRQRARAPHLDVDGLDKRGGLFRRELVRRGPARGATDKAQPLLPVDPVHLVDHTVNVVAEAGPHRLDGSIVREQLIDVVTALHQRVDRQAPGLEGLHDAELGVSGQPLHVAPGIGKEAQRPRGRDGGVKLPQGTRRRVARIGELLVIRLALARVQRGKVGMPEIGLAAHLEHAGHIAGELLRNVGDGARIDGDVLALLAIAACGCLHQPPLLISQCQRQPVDFGFRREHDRHIGA